MCFECRVLGALLNSGRDAPDVVAECAQFDFCPTVMEIEDKELLDEHAFSYLDDTLDMFRDKFGVEFVPIKVDSDGSCLPHAISRCLVGKEILYDGLRSALEKELRDHSEFYKSVFQQGMDDESFQVFWDTIIEESKPTNGAPTGRWLGPEHIFGFANLLKRPILVLDKLEEMMKADHRSGLYLPLRHSRESLGSIASPIVIGWANTHKNHFVSLTTPSRNCSIAMNDDELEKRAQEANPELWKNVEGILQTELAIANGARGDPIQILIPEGKMPGDVCMLTDDAGNQFAAQVPEGKKPGDTFEFYPHQGESEDRSLKLKRAATQFYGRNPPITRTKSAATLYTVLNNLVDSLTGNIDKFEKVRTLKKDNKLIKQRILDAEGAVELLRVVHFLDKIDESGAPVLRFEGNLGDSDMCQSLVCARDIMLIMKNDTSRVVGAGEIPFKQEAEAFGPIPAFQPKMVPGSVSEIEEDDEWAAARPFSSMYDPKKPSLSAAWLFGQGNTIRVSSYKVKKLVDKLKMDYEVITKGTEFQAMPWDDLFMYNRRLTHVKCPGCSFDQEWTREIDGFLGDARLQQCEKCEHELTVDLTGQRRMGKFIYDSIQNGISHCKTHDVLFIDSCPSCVGEGQPPVPPTSS